MKVLFIPSWYPCEGNPHAGRFFVEQARAVAETGLAEVTLLNWGQNAYQLKLRQPWQSLLKLGRYFRAKSGQKEIAANLTECKIPHLSWASQLRKGNIEALARKLDLNDIPDLIHAQVTFPAGYLAWLLAQRYGVPYIITEHSGPFPFPEFVSKKGVSRLILDPLEHADKILAVSSFLKHEIHNKTGLNAQVLPNLVDTDLYTISGKARQDGPLRLFTLTEMSVAKGSFDLLQALKLAHQQGLDFQFVWGGTGKLSKQLTKQAEEYGLQGKITFAGTMTSEQALASYQECDCFVLASRLETFSVVLIEALACGKPVISTNCGGPRDIVKDFSGYLVPKQNPVALGEAILKMSRQYHTFPAERIRNYCRDEFGKRTVGLQIIKVYEEVLGVEP